MGSRLLSLADEVLDDILVRALGDQNPLLNVRTAKALLCCCSRVVSEAIKRIQQEELRSLVFARVFTPLTDPNVIVDLDPEATVYVDWRKATFGFMASDSQLKLVLEHLEQAVSRGRIMLRFDRLEGDRQDVSVPSVKRFAVEEADEPQIDKCFVISVITEEPVEVVSARKGPVIICMGSDINLERVISNGIVAVASPFGGYCCEQHNSEFGFPSGAGYWQPPGCVDVKAHLNRCNNVAV